MTITSIESRLADVERFKFNPTAIQRAAMLAVRQATEGAIDIVDPTNPFVLAMENTAVTVSGFMQHAQALNRRQYPIAAHTEDDLYMHMSDKDYLGRFAIPSDAVMVMLLRYDELLNAMVLDPSTGVRQLTLARYSKFQVAGVTWTLEWPIHIRLELHGGLSVVYDATQESPTSPLTTNQVIKDEVKDPNGVKFLELRLPLKQFAINTVYNNVDQGSGFVTTVDLTDSYYYARVYVQNDDQSWREIQTTHTDQVYNAATPTALLRVLSNQLRVTIPAIYTTLGTIAGKLRVDVYETKGELNMLLENYNMIEFTADFSPIDPLERTPEVVAIGNVRTKSVYSHSNTTGGRAALPMEELRTRVINHSVGEQDEPISNVQLFSTLQDTGYEIVRNVDTLTNRIFLAAKEMPLPRDERLLTAAASSVQTAIFRLSQLNIAHGAIMHDFGVTLSPEALYKSVNGVTSLVSKQDYQTFDSMTNAQKVVALQDNTYLYSPFHYVLDTSNRNFACRAYYMESPEVISKSFVAENAALGYQCSVERNYALERIAGGYRLILQTRSSRAFRQLEDSQVFAQIAFRSNDQSVVAYMTGVQQPRATNTDERIYFFDMLTDFAIDAVHSLDQNSFTFSPTELTTRCTLDQVFSVFFGTTAGGSSAPSSSIDTQLGLFQLPANARGVTQERMRIRFGHHLNTLWTQARSVVAQIPYMRHSEDIPDYHPVDVFDVDPQTGAHFTVTNEGELTYLYKHRAGDPILNEDGSPKLAAKAGEIMLDSQGFPIPVVGFEDELVRHVDITLIEGVYRFATDTVAREYYQYLNASLVNWLTEDLAEIQPLLLDKTNIYFYPKMNQGQVSVLLRDGEYSRIEAGQAFTVKLLVPQATAENPMLLEALKRSSIRTIDQHVRGTSVSVSKIEAALLQVYGTDVMAVTLEGLGGSANYPLVSVVGGAQRLAIRKRALAQADGQLIIEEDVTFLVEEHTVD